MSKANKISNTGDLFSGELPANQPKKLFYNKAARPEVFLGKLSFEERNARARGHIALFAKMPGYSDGISKLLEQRTSQIYASGKISVEAMGIQLLFEVRSLILLPECKRLLARPKPDAVEFSQNLKKNTDTQERMTWAINAVKREAEEISMRFPGAANANSTASKLSYYKSAADNAAHYQILKTLCAMEVFDIGVSPADYYFMLLEKHAYPLGEFKHLDKMKHVLMLRDLENALFRRGRLSEIDKEFTSEILFMPFYTREFL